jgi:hypothetical protein
VEHLLTLHAIVVENIPLKYQTKVHLTNLTELVFNAISGVTNLIPVHFEATDIRETTMGWEGWPTPSSSNATEQAFGPKRKIVENLSASYNRYGVLEVVEVA